MTIDISHKYGTIDSRNVEDCKSVKEFSQQP